MLADLDPVGAERLADPADQGGWGWSILGAATLRINPYWANILSLYVVAMLLSLVVLELLRRNLPLLAGGFGLAVYAVSIVRPSWGVFQREAGLPGTLSWAGWFGLFTVGLLAGWYWRRGVQQAVSTTTALAATAAVSLLGIAVTRTGLDAAVPGVLVDKAAMGPLRILFSVAFFAAGYGLLIRATRVQGAGPVLHPFTLVGQRSLDCYLILSTFVLALPSVWAYDQASLTGVSVALFAFALCIAWARFRQWRDPVKPAIAWLVRPFSRRPVEV